MAEYIYLPVPSDEMKGMARDMQAVRARKQLVVPQLLHNAHIAGHRKGFEHLFNGCLKRVSGTDIVYLLMHGAGRARRGFTTVRRYAFD